MTSAAQLPEAEEECPPGGWLEVTDDVQPVLAVGHVLEQLPRIRSKSVHMVVFSPPYWPALRSYFAEPVIFDADPGCQHDWSRAFVLKGRDNRNGLGESSLGPGDRFVVNLRDKDPKARPLWSDSSGLKKGDRPGRTEEQRKRILKDSPKRFNQPASASSVFCSKCSGWKGQLGQEPTPDLFVRHMVLIMREVRRVLRDDGTVWIVIGDGWIGDKGEHYGDTDGNLTAKTPTAKDMGGRHDVGTPQTSGLLRKSMALVPQRLSIALAEDGWVFRIDNPSVIAWEKPNCLGGATRLYARNDNGFVGPISAKDMGRWPGSAGKWELWNGERWTRVIRMWRQERSPKSPSLSVRCPNIKCAAEPGQPCCRNGRWGAGTGAREGTRNRAHNERVEAARDDDTEIELVLRSGETIACTRSHRWPTKRGLLRASDIVVGDVLESGKLPEPAAPVAPAFVPDEVGWFVGLYLAEGSRGGQKTGGEPATVLQIACHRDEGPSWYEKIQSLSLSYHGSNGGVFYTGNGASIHVTSRVLMSVVDEYVSGSTAHDKHLSRKVWERSDAFLRNLLMGYLEGDGGYDPGNDLWRLGFCQNQFLVNDLRTIAARLGATLTLKPAHAKYQGGVKPTFRGELRWQPAPNMRKGRAEVVAIRHNLKGRQGYWDLQVADEPHTFSIASGVLTHNCLPSSADDNFTKNHEYVLVLAKSAGKALYWVHRDKPIGTRKCPEPDYRYIDHLNGDAEQEAEPQNWRTERMPPLSDKVGPLTGEVIFHDARPEEERELRWKRINLWSSHDYFFDEVAIREPNVSTEQAEHNQRYARVYDAQVECSQELGEPGNVNNTGIHSRPGPGGRNARSVWWNAVKLGEEPERLIEQRIAQEPEADIETNWEVFSVPVQPYKGTHSATFPEKLVEKTIMAGSSARGACKACGAPYERMVKIGREPDPTVGQNALRGQGADRLSESGPANRENREFERISDIQTIGWQPTCGCGEATIVPCRVLDIFAGAATTLLVSRKNGRKGIGIELSKSYAKEAMKRIVAAQSAITAFSET